MNITIYDFNVENVNQFLPFSINHASFELKVGLFSNFERIKLYCLKNNIEIDQIYLVVRKEIEELIKEKYPECIVNPPSDFNKGKEFKGNIVYDYSKNKNNILLCYLWDIFTYSPEFFLNDIAEYKFNAISSFPSATKFFDTIHKKFDLATLVNEKDIIINEDSDIKAGVVIDAENAPIIIGKNVIVDIGALIQGPVFIDDNAYIAPGAKIRPSTYIGKYCKVGGEVSCSIINDYSNKVHGGFLGHSFIGEWVNIGAGTNNSNLKNDYSNIKFNFGDGKGFIDTQKQFLGAFIGDYSRFGISTMLNTGTHIGIGSNVFGAGYQNRLISSFSWGKENRVNFEKFIETCKKMKQRRNLTMSNAEFEFLKAIYNKNL